MTYDKSIFPRPTEVEVSRALKAADKYRGQGTDGLVSVLAAEVLALREENERLRARLARVAELDADLLDEGES